MIDLDRADLDRFLPPTPGPADWDDVMNRARAADRRRRLGLVALAAAALVVVGAASAIGSVREMLFGERRIAAGAATWSPDGRRISFVSVECPPRNCSGRAELNVMNADGTGQRSLTREWGLQGVGASLFQGLPVWSPDWRKLAFVQERDGRRYSDIYVINADGSGRRQLTRSPQNDGNPVWSHDGRKLAFVRIQRNRRADIYVVNAEGGGLRRLAHATAFPPPGEPTPGLLLYVDLPSWSSDGRTIAFVSNRDGDDDIFVVNADGSGLRKLTHNRQNDRHPVWSSDGRVIVFQSRRALPTQAERAVCRSRCWREEISAVNADRSGLRRLTHNWKTDSPAAWSPDGRKLLFIRAGHIWVMNTDGTGKRNLTRSVAQPFSSDGAPAWSPDGRKILFVSNRGDGNWFEVYVMNADGSGIRQLTRLKG